MLLPGLLPTAGWDGIAHCRQAPGWSVGLNLTMTQVYPTCSGYNQLEGLHCATPLGMLNTSQHHISFEGSCLCNSLQMWFKAPSGYLRWIFRRVLVGLGVLDMF